MLSSTSASAIAAALHLHATLQLALPRSVLPDDHLLLACRSDGAVAACACPRVHIGELRYELRTMSKLREHAREVGRAHFCLDRNDMSVPSSVLNACTVRPECARCAPK